MTIRKQAKGVSCGPKEVEREGVTLLELLLAVSILAVISVVVSMTLSVGVETWRTGTSLADEAHHADAVMEQVVMALKSAYYPETKDPTYEFGFKHKDGGEAPAAEDIISWVKIGNSLIGEDVPWAGSAHRVELFIKTDDADEGPGLYVKAWQLVGQDEEFDPEEDVTPLLISDKVISFECRMKDPDYAEIAGEPYQWLDEWTSSNRLPTHVLVSIAIKPQKEKEEPLEFTRMVQLPMSSLSWNPIQTRSSDTAANQNNNSNVPNRRTSGGATSNPNDATGTSGSGRINSSGFSGDGRSTGSGGIRSPRDNRNNTSRPSRGPSGGNASGNDGTLRINSAGGGR